MMFYTNRTEHFVRDWDTVTPGCITPARRSPKVRVKIFVCLKYRTSAAEAFCPGDWNFAASS